MNLNDLSTSPYLASDDYTVGTVLPPMVIERIKMADVPTPGTTKKQAKATMYFVGQEKGYVINKNVGRRIAKELGTGDNIDKAWLGAVIELKVEGNVRRPDGTSGNAFRLHSAKRGAPAVADPNIAKCRELGPKVKAKLGSDDLYKALKDSHGTDYAAMAAAFEGVLNAS